ncbi:MAG TPA: VOC family protein, partial [Gammaproteobacteria bacterium]|nr:VOC family protein [Gammaproteobacteria bacterium]
MLDSIDHIIIAVEDICSAKDSYTKLLGFPPTWNGVHPSQGTENVLFPLKNLYVELLAANGEGPGATMIKSFLELNGEGLSGMALGTSNIE